MKKLLFSLLAITHLSVIGQVQIGQNITGNNSLERLGNISTNDAGNRIAVGSNDSSNGYSFNGKIQVYELNANTWTQIGQNITGIQNSSNIGLSLDFSGDGNFIATGSFENLNNSFNGYARVFQISSGNLVQVGQTLTGDTNEHFGAKVAISKNGSVLAVSSITETSLNKVKVYQNIAGTWSQIGQTIYGLELGDDTGKKIELSDDGLTLLVTSPDTRNASNNKIGLARVFRYNGSLWFPLGATFTGVYSSDIINDASISEDGNIIAIGSPNNIRTMQFDGTNWVARGFSFSQFGPFEIKLKNNGNTLFFSNSSNNFSNVPTVFRFKYNSGTWRMSGAPIGLAGSNSISYFDASSNGEIMAFGNVQYTNVSQENGIAKVFDFTNFSQTCQTASTLTANSGTINIGTISGAITTGGVCYNYSQPNPNANWWAFTPTQNGLLDITTVTAQNATNVDSRISIYTGNCNSLTCLAGNDNVSTTDLRSDLKNITLQAGITYYFVFDDKVSDTSTFNFFYEFTPQTCFVPVSLISAISTENTISLNWFAPTIGNTPQSYTIQIGPRDYTVDSAAAVQTITGVTGTSHTITGLNPNTVYDVYMKSNCSGADSSIWNNGIRVYTEFTAVNPTYSENFDNDISFLFVGWNRSGGTTNTLWRTYTSGPNAFTQNGSNAIYSITNPVLSTPTNVYAYSRKLNLVAGQNYNVSYYTRQFLASGVFTNGFLQVNYVPNTNYTNAATHTQINALTVIPDNAYINQNHIFTVPTSGEYRIAFRNALQRSSTSSTTATAWLMLDNVVVSTALSVAQFEKFGLNFYPNPVLNYITIQNPENIQINNYTVIDLNGRALQNNVLQNNNLIDLSSLSKGIYMIQLDTEKGILTKKIIKE